MQKFKIMSEISEAKMSVESQSLENLFQNSLLGMNQLLKKDSCKNMDGSLVISEFELSAPDTTFLLINFLSEILTSSHATHIIFCSVEFLTLSDRYLMARIEGTKVDKFDRDLRTVSYHMADVIKNQKGNYKADIIFAYR